MEKNSSLTPHQFIFYDIIKGKLIPGLIKRKINKHIKRKFTLTTNFQARGFVALTIPRHFDALVLIATFKQSIPIVNVQAKHGNGVLLSAVLRDENVNSSSEW